MVEEASNAIEITSERKGFINYWFRHIWEYVLPTYPGLILASALTGFQLDQLILYQMPFALMVIITGSIFCFRGINIPNSSHTAVKRGRDVRKLIISLLPIGSVILFVGLFRIDIAITMGVVVLALFIYHRYSLRKIADTFRDSISWNVFLIIAGVIFFKEMLEATGAVQGISQFFTGTGFPIIILFFILPFLVGILTGLTIAFVGATFPILITMSGGAPEIGHIAFAFASGFTGVMFSPVHLCFVLTGEYFQADRGIIYRYMIVPSSMVMLTAVVMWMVG
jgi:integral membrane protein (TIGR00529 family)